MVRWIVVCAGVCAMAAGLSGCGGGSEPEASAEESGIDLSPRLAPGAGGEYEHTLAMRERRVITPGGEVGFEGVITRRFAVEVESALEGGGARVRFSMRRFSMAIQGANQPDFVFDTDMAGQRDEDAVRRSLRALAGLTFHAEVDAAGNVRRLDGFREAVSELPRAPAQAAEFYDENWFVSSIEAVWSAAAGVTRREVGESWSAESMGMVGDTGIIATTVITHRLAAAEGDEAVIEGEGHVDMNFDSDPLTRGGISRVDDQSYTFRKVWSLRDGRLVGYETDQGIEFVIDYSGIRQDVSRWSGSGMRLVGG